MLISFLLFQGSIFHFYISPPPVYENNLGNGSNKRRRFHPKREMLLLKAQLLSKAIKKNLTHFTQYRNDFQNIFEKMLTFRTKIKMLTRRVWTATGNTLFYNQNIDFFLQFVFIILAKTPFFRLIIRFSNIANKGNTYLRIKVTYFQTLTVII